MVVRKPRWWRMLAVFVAVFFTMSAVNDAQALWKPFPGRVNNLMVKVVQQRAARMGLNAADPRIAATVAGMSSAGGDLLVSAGVAAVAGTPIGWGGIILGALVVAGVTYYMSRGNGTPVIKDADGTVHIAGLSGGVVGGALRNDSRYFEGSGVQGSSIHKAGQAWAELLNRQQGANPPALYKYDGCTFGSSSETSGTCYALRPAYKDSSGSDWPQSRRSTSFYRSSVNWQYTECASGMAISRVCTDGQTADPNPQIKSDPYTLPSLLPAEELNKPASPDLMAKVANRLMRDAANQPGYAGLPYSMTDPITATDMEQLYQANPEAWPDLGDLTAPAAEGAVAGETMPTKVPLPANGTLDETDPAYVPAPNTGTNPSTQPQQNLGPDPGTPAPRPEAQTPTANSILDPIFNYVPNLISANLSVPTGECPAPTFTAYNHEYVINQHCSIIEDNRALISAMMLFVWALSACLIVLRA